MKHNEFLQEGHGVSCYSCCFTCLNFQHEQQQEVTKKHLTLLGAKSINMD